MKLYFVCPVRADIFSTDQWEIAGCEAIALDGDGNKYLRGAVTVLCPWCAQKHIYTPDELPCPLTVGTKEQKKS